PFSGAITLPWPTDADPKIVPTPCCCSAPEAAPSTMGSGGFSGRPFCAEFVLSPENTPDPESSLTSTDLRSFSSPSNNDVSTTPDSAPDNPFDNTFCIAFFSVTWSAGTASEDNPEFLDNTPFRVSLDPEEFAVTCSVVASEVVVSPFLLT